VVAIGEAGLDYFYDTQKPEDQKTGLRRHIEAARRTQLPLVIHSRSADDDMAEILTEETGKGAFPFILHCFSSGQALADTGVALGGYVSFSGILTFPKSTELREIAKTVPMDRLLVETDAPYLAPKRWRGKRNEPSYVVNTAEVLAEVKGVSYEEIARYHDRQRVSLFSRRCRAVTQSPPPLYCPGLRLIAGRAAGQWRLGRLRSAESEKPADPCRVPDPADRRRWRRNDNRHRHRTGFPRADDRKQGAQRRRCALHPFACRSCARD
jgi:hypothetical protein